MNPDLVAQLRDIHSAPAVPWWPPAPGWWVVALLLLAVLFWFGRQMAKRYHARQTRKQMLDWIDFLNVMVDPKGEPQAYISTLNRILKLVALKAFPEENCAAMSGTVWVDFLRSKAKKGRPADFLDALASGPFDPNPTFDSMAICAFTSAWIKQHG